MSKPFDATGKHLLEADPAGWAAFLGVTRPPERVELFEAELSTVTAAADKVLRIKDESPWILDVEFQSWRDPSLPWQLLKYNALLHDKHGIPVASVLVVLAEKADPPAYTGCLEVAPPFGPAWEFRYTVIKVWELKPEPLLTGSLALLPLALVSDIPLTRVPEVLRQVSGRVKVEADPTTADELLTAVGVLLQLRYGAVTADQLIEGVTDIRDLAIFKKFLREGEVTGHANGLRGVLLRQGRKKFGPPTPEQEAAVNAIKDLPRLEALSEKILDVTTWDDLLKAD